jgi:glc operon protein GlcG
MDHAALLAGVELAPGKARTAALFKVIVDGEVIGAIGVSADTKEHDAQIARAGLAALKF